MAHNLIQCLMVAGCLWGLHAQAMVYYVATNGNNSTGTDWANAFTNLQSALTAAGNGDEIRVAGHTFWVASQLDWSGVSGVSILGGWEGVGDPGNRDTDLWPTVIQRNPSVFTRLLRVQSVTGVVEDVAFQGGFVQAAPYLGGGILASNATLVLNRCRLVSNQVLCAATIQTLGGGGLYAGACSLRVTNSVVAWNSVVSTSMQNVVWGGGIHVDRGTAELVSSVVSGNLARGKGATAAGTQDYGYGGGVAASGSLDVRDSVVHGNRVSGSSYTSADKTHVFGAGLYASGSLSVQGVGFKANRAAGGYLVSAQGGGIYSKGPLWLRDAVFQDNTSADVPGGGGLYTLSNAVSLVNLLVMVNDAPAGDGVYLNRSTGSVANCLFAYNDGEGLRQNLSAVGVSNSVFWGNGDDLAGFPTNAGGVLPDVWHCDTENGDNAGVQGCLSDHPLFERGFYLSPASPCVDAGGATAAEAGLDTRTTRADGAWDSGVVDLGYHFATGINWSVADLYVSGGGSDGNSGASWAQAYRSITMALSAARDGSRIHVGEGLYTNLLETFPLAIDDRIGLRLMGTNPASCVVDAIGAGQRCLLVRDAVLAGVEGLTFANGYLPGADMIGAGILFSNAVATLDSCVVMSNELNASGIHWAYNYGAGICEAGQSVLDITNCAIVGNRNRLPTAFNTHIFGGGCAFLGGRCRIARSAISSNVTLSVQSSYTASGGGIYSVIPLAITDSVLARNQVGSTVAASRGGAIYAAANLDLRNVVLASNDAYSTTGVIAGDGLYMAAASLAMTQVTFAANGGQGVWFWGTGAVSAANSIFWNNGDDLVNFPTNPAGVLSNVWYCDIQNADNLGVQGCISLDPLFADGTNDVHLRSSGGRWAGTNWAYDLVDSPCLDRGDPAADFANEPLPNGGRVNMGAYGNTWQASKTFTYPGIRMPVLTNAVMRGKAAPSQVYSLGVTNGYSRRVILNATPGVDWVVPQPASGSTTGDIYDVIFTNTYATEYLPAGSNVGFARIEAFDEWTGLPCSNSPGMALVIMQVMELARSATNLSVYGLAGHNPPDEPFQVWNAGAGPMAYRISDDVAWMHVLPSNGVSRSAADAQTHYIIFDTGGLGAGGTYSGQILVTATNGGGAVSVIQVELTVGESPEMAVSKSLLTNEVTIGFGGTNGFSIRRAAGAVPLAWSCSVIEGGAWLSVSPTNGQSTGEWDPVQVTFSPSVAPGANRGRIRVTGTAAGYGNPAVGSPQDIEVLVQGVERPTLSVSPAVLTNRVVQGFDAPWQTLRVINGSGKGVLRYRVADDVPWLVPEPESGVVERGAVQADVRLRYSTASLEPGRYEAQVVVTGEDVEHGGSTPGSPAVVAVALDITPLSVLALDRTELSRQVRQGGVATAQVFRVRNGSQEPKGVLAFRAEAGTVEGAGSGVVPWLTLSPASGTSAGEWAEVTVAYDASDLAPGLYQARVTVSGTDSASGKEALDSPAELLVSLQVLRPTSGDFTGDNRTDLTLYEESAGRWYVYSLTQGILAWAAALGGPGYAPVLGDFDGDGRTDLGVYRAASAGWYVRRLEEERLMATAVWGGARLEAVVGDFDGDGVSDFGVYERGSGLWYIRSVGGAILAWALSWGGPAFAPVAGDFDGDARSDLAAYDTALGQWYILSLGLRNAREDSFPEAPGGASGVGSPASLSSSPRGPGLIAWGVAWGGTGLTALTGDFDGDGRDDLAVYQPGTGNWYVRSLTGGILAWAVNWGGGGFTPVVGDFDGDGKADIGAYHTATGTWYVRTVSGALVLWGFPWGGAGLRPL